MHTSTKFTSFFYKYFTICHKLVYDSIDAAQSIAVKKLICMFLQTTVQEPIFSIFIVRTTRSVWYTNQ